MNGSLLSMAEVATEDIKSSSKSRGERLEVLRKMAGLTRKRFEEKYGVSANTIQSWESAKAGGLTERGAQRILPLLQREGIFCTLNWLLHAVGSPPQLTHPRCLEIHDTTVTYEVSENIAIVRELLVFRKLHENSTDLIVSDDGLGPHYKPGDYVAGILRKDDNLQSLIGLDCIVQIDNDEQLLRRIKSSSVQGYYDLICTNPNTTVSKPVLYRQELISAAPIIWHRRQDV